jgi:hypothetical protein
MHVLLVINSAMGHSENLKIGQILKLIRQKNLFDGIILLQAVKLHFVREEILMKKTIHVGNSNFGFIAEDLNILKFSY